MTAGDVARVLLVEDDPDDALLAREMLHEAGFGRYEIHWVAAYDEALREVLAGTYDVALVDYRLGPRTGLDLLRAAVAAGLSRPFVLLTGEGDPAVDQAALEAGAMDYLPKADLTPTLLDRSIRYAMRGKRVEQRLLSRERELTALVQGNPDIVMRLDRAGKLLFANATLEQATGRTSAEILGRTDAQLGMLGGHHERWSRACAACFESGEPQEVEFALRRPAGVRTFDARLVPERTQEGEVASVLVVARDITALREAVRANQQFAAAFDSLSAGVLITDATRPDDPVVYVNPGFLSLTGYGPEEVLGRNCRFLQGPGTDPSEVERIRRCIARGETFRGTLLNYRKDGSAFWNELVISPVRDESGQVVNHVGIQTDVTAQRAAEEELRRQKEELQTILEHVPVMINFFDPDGRSIWVNLCLQRVLGWNLEEMQGRNMLEEFFPDPQVRAQVQAHMERADASWRDFEVRTHSGSLVPTTWANVRLGDGRSIGIGQDITERKQVEDRLRRKEEHFRSLIEHGGDLIALLDPQHRVAFASPSLTRLLGYRFEELLGVHISEIIHPEDLDTVLDTLRSIAAHPGQPASAEYRIRHRDGSFRVQEAVAVGRSEDGGGAGIVINARDVTERKRAEEERERLFRKLEMERTRLAQAFARAPSFFALVRGPEHVFELTNAAYCRLVGRENLIGQRVEDALPEVAEQGYVALLDRVLQTGEPFIASEVPIRLRRAAAGPLEERVVTFVYDAYVEADGSRSGVFAHGVDVTEQVRAREAAERSAAAARLNLSRLQAVLDALPVGVFLTDAAGTVELANPAAVRIWGGRAPLVSRDRYGEYQAWHPGMDRRLEVDDWPISRVLRTGEAGVDQEIEILGFDGVRRSILASAARFLDGNGSVAGAVAVMVDVTERRRLEEALRLAQRMESVGRLAGGVAHDFNNLLTVIGGNVRFALEDLAPDSPCREDLAEVLRAAERAAELTRQLLAFSRRQVLQTRRLSLNDVISGTERMLRRLIGEDVRLETVLDPHLDEVEADPTQVDQVLMNLAVNARDAMPTGGHLVIRTTNVALTPAEAEQYAYPVNPGNYVELAVRDTGTGMDEETLNHLFEPFYSTKGSRGTGLGLSTVYGIVKQSGGYIWAQSAPGRGTTFRILLPRAEGDAGRGGPEEATAKDGAGAGQTILLVEDDDAVRSVQERVLLRAGYRVLAAASAEDAVRLAGAHPGRIALLLTDVVMPGKSGRELAEVLRRSDPAMRVLFTSGYMDDAVVRHGVDAADVGYLQKPSTPDDLLAAIAAALLE